VPMIQIPAAATNYNIFRKKEPTLPQPTISSQCVIVSYLHHSASQDHTNHGLVNAVEIVVAVVIIDCHTGS
jgi:hypothetical protein